MSEGMNRVMLRGFVLANPQLGATQVGDPALTFQLVTVERYVDHADVRRERTETHQIKVPGARAREMAGAIAIGDRLVVEGRIETETYLANGNEDRSRTVIIATSVAVIGAQPRILDGRSS